MLTGQWDGSAESRTPAPKSAACGCYDGVQIRNSDGARTLTDERTEAVEERAGIARLVERIRSGDGRAEEELVERYGRGIAILLARHTNGRPEAEDLYQEAFRLALEKLRRGELRQAEKLPGFLARIARNLAIEHYRKLQRRRTQVDSEAAGAASVDSSQLQRLLAGEHAGIVRRVLAELRNRRDREILFRYYIAEEERERICADLALTGPQFNRVLHRARERYRDLYLRRSRAGDGQAGDRAAGVASAIVLLLPGRRHRPGCDPAPPRPTGMTEEHSPGAPAMDHAYVEDHDLIARYDLGRLAPEEEARFEAHFVACSRCQDELEAARGLRLGLRAVACEEAVRASAVIRIGLAARLAGLARRSPWALAAAAALVAAVVTSGWFLAGAGRSATAVVQAPVATSVVLLAVPRGEGAEPTTVERGAAGSWLALAVDVGDDPRFASFRVTISNAVGEVLWQRGGLRPNALETLMISVPGSYLAAGSYRLTVDGERPGGGVETLASYPFRVSG